MFISLISSFQNQEGQIFSGFPMIVAGAPKIDIHPEKSLGAVRSAEYFWYAVMPQVKPIRQ